MNDDLSFISAFRDKAEQVRLQELNKAMRQINNGKDPTEILGELSKSLTNKLIHSPTSAIRQASRAGRREIISNLKEIYEISDLNTAKRNEVSKNHEGIAVELSESLQKKLDSLRERHEEVSSL